MGCLGTRLRADEMELINEPAGGNDRGGCRSGCSAWPQPTATSGTAPPSNPPRPPVGARGPGGGAADIDDERLEAGPPDRGRGLSL